MGLGLDQARVLLHQDHLPYRAEVPCNQFIEIYSRGNLMATLVLSVPVYAVNAALFISVN